MLKTVFKGAVLRNSAFAASTFRAFHRTSVSKLREIVVEKVDDKTTVIGAKFVDSERSPYLLKLNSNSSQCFLCQLQLDLKHTDVLILSQFVNSKGEVLKRSDINICLDQYNLIKNLIYMAQHAGLMPEPPRARPKKPYEMLNTYYDEKTIVLRKKRHIIPNKLLHLKLGPIEKFRIRPELGVQGKYEKKFKH